MRANARAHRAISNFRSHPMPEAIAEEIRQARREALEEAAQISDQRFDRNWPDEYKAASELISKDIRALMEKEG